MRHNLFSALAGIWLLGAGTLLAQDAPAPPPPDQMLSPDQLNDLVAPVALYPDPLLSQVLVATTYPLEVVQAYQWLQKNPGLTGPALAQAAQDQNWDASVQALVIYPDVLKRLNDDVAWTTNLGNAFLAQQQDVMAAVQRMRQSAQQAGKLQSTPQETVQTNTDAGGPYIEIEPASPDVMYVPVYDPAWIWGPPMWYPYPHWWWPPRSFLTGGMYFGFGGPVNVGFYFGAGWHGWGGWGWHPGWGNRTVIVNNTFIHRYNLNTHVRDVRGNSVWSHDVAHRQGVPYANQALRSQYRSDVRQNISRPSAEQVRPQFQQGGERFGNREVPRNTPQAQNRGIFGGMNNGSAARQNADHGYSSMGPARSAPSGRTFGGGGGRPSGGGGGRPSGGGGGRPSGGGGGGRGGR
jgi:hypothetical protein